MIKLEKEKLERDRKRGREKEYGRVRFFSGRTNVLAIASILEIQKHQLAASNALFTEKFSSFKVCSPTSSKASSNGIIERKHGAAYGPASIA